MHSSTWRNIQFNQIIFIYVDSAALNLYFKNVKKSEVNFFLPEVMQNEIPNTYISKKGGKNVLKMP